LEDEYCYYYYYVLYSLTEYNEKRKVLLRSTGSFSIIEDNIVVPAPRRLSSVPSSPIRSRREKRKSTDERIGRKGEKVQGKDLGEGPPMSMTCVVMCCLSPHPQVNNWGGAWEFHRDNKGENRSRWK